jgi:hypothetical protein
MIREIVIDRPMDLFLMESSRRFKPPRTLVRDKSECYVLNNQASLS